jgi:uncharacterized protein YgiM (DUF1202 family)
MTDEWHGSCFFKEEDPNLKYLLVMKGRREMKKIPVFILLPLCLLACAAVNHSPSGNSVAAPPTSGVETFSPSPSTIPSDKSLVTVTWTFANIRSGVGNDYPIVKFVKQGDKLRVIGESGDWFNIRLENGEQGWISNRVVK